MRMPKQELMAKLEKENVQGATDRQTNLEAKVETMTEATVEEVNQLRRDLVEENEEAGEHATSEVERVRNLRVQKLLTDTEYRDLKQKYGNVFEAGMGADAIRSQPRSSRSALANGADRGQHHGPYPHRVERYAPCPMVPQQGDGQQGERRLAGEGNRCPRDALAVRSAPTLDKHCPAGDDEGGGDDLGPGRPVFQQRPGDTKDDRGAGHCDGDGSWFGVSHAAYYGDVEQDQPCGRDAHQPGPVPCPGPHDGRAAHSG